ncbi:MAG TPA: hypothetical protein VFZ83_12555 [Acidimicrobiia bacterium]|nr:hypothetical protein [Acidimicrobiia bacterium]
MRTTERIRRVLDPAYSADLSALDVEALRARKIECAQLETAVSYYRRLAQGRVEILVAERDRRARGGSIEELIAQLPTILAGESDRPDAVNARFADAEAPIIELHFDGGEESLVADDGLALFTRSTSAELEGAIERLRSFEAVLSGTRRSLHDVIDRIELELAARQATGALG